jgi:hypothetical protein
MFEVTEFGHMCSTSCVGVCTCQCVCCCGSIEYSDTRGGGFNGDANSDVFTPKKE